MHKRLTNLKDLSDFDLWELAQQILNERGSEDFTWGFEKIVEIQGESYISESLDLRDRQILLNELKSFVMHDSFYANEYY